MARRGSEIVDVDYERIKIIGDHRKAILFVINGEDKWLPRSLIEVDTDARVVTMPIWLAVEKELV